MKFCPGVADDQYLRNGEMRWLARRPLKGGLTEVLRTERRHGVRAAE
jgi:asparagine synthase (glutamine-hydrolysing)